MRGKLNISILSTLLFTSSSMAQAWWEKKPYQEWSVREVDRMLNDSPWVAITPLHLPRQSAFPLNLRFLLLTARPIREGYLRRLSFPANVQKGPDFENTIPVDQAKARDKAEESQARLKRFMSANQGDIRVRGDERHIVIAVALSQFVPPSASRWAIDTEGRQIRTEISQSPWIEEPRPEFLMGSKLSDWVGRTYVTTNLGKRAEVVRYDPPGLDLLGAKFYFSRRTPDGKILIGDGDDELRFETRIGGKQVRVKFDLKKMKYKGKLET